MAVRGSKNGRKAVAGSRTKPSDLGVHKVKCRPHVWKMLAGAMFREGTYYVTSITQERCVNCFKTKHVNKIIKRAMF